MHDVMSSPSTLSNLPHPCTYLGAPSNGHSSTMNWTNNPPQADLNPNDLPHESYYPDRDHHKNTLEILNPSPANIHANNIAERLLHDNVLMIPSSIIVHSTWSLLQPWSYPSLSFNSNPSTPVKLPPYCQPTYLNLQARSWTQSWESLHQFSPHIHAYQAHSARLPHGSNGN